MDDATDGRGRADGVPARAGSGCAGREAAAVGRGGEEERAGKAVVAVITAARAKDKAKVRALLLPEVQKDLDAAGPAVMEMIATMADATISEITIDMVGPDEAKGRVTKREGSASESTGMTIKRVGGAGRSACRTVGMRLSTQRRRSALLLGCAATAGCGHHAASTRVPLQADVRAAASPPRQAAHLAEERRDQLRALDVGSAASPSRRRDGWPRGSTLTNSQQRRLMEILRGSAAEMPHPERDR
jgi:hypothetical protein